MRNERRSILLWGSTILVLASVALFFGVPRWAQSKLESNEENALKVVRDITKAQEQFLRTTRAAYGTFRQLAAKEEALIRGERKFLKMPLLSSIFSDPDEDGVVVWKGYCFRIDLVGEAYEIYAWPQKYGSTGRRTFAATCNHRVVSINDPRYSGLGSGPLRGSVFYNFETEVLAVPGWRDSN